MQINQKLPLLFVHFSNLTIDSESGMEYNTNRVRIHVLPMSANIPAHSEVL